MAKRKRFPPKIPAAINLHENDDFVSSFSQVNLADAGMDEIDSFAAQQETILFDSEQEKDDEESEEEVFALGPNQNEDDDLDNEQLLRITRDLGSSKKSSLDDDDRSQSEDEEDADVSWGKSKAAYYDADDVSDDDEKAKEEEVEAMRLRRQHVARMKEEDYADDFLDSFKSKLHGCDAGENLMDLATQQSSQNPIFIESPEYEKTMSIIDDVSKWLKEHDNSHPLNQLAMILLINAQFLVVLLKTKNDKAFDETLVEKVLKFVTELICIWEGSETVKNSIVNTSTINDIVEENSFICRKGGIKKKASSKKTSPMLQIEKKDPSETSIPMPVTVELAAIPSVIDVTIEKKVKRRNLDDVVNPFEVDEVEAKEREASRRSSQFQASGMDLADARKANRSKKKLVMTGDQDIPYRDSKTGRILVKAETANDSMRTKVKQLDSISQNMDLTNSDEDLDLMMDWMDEPHPLNHDNDEASYYEEVKAAKLNRNSKKARTVNDDDAISDVNGITPSSKQDVLNGKRGVSWNIIANKGLTPKRKKELRNPRVKKRRKFEKAIKKLSSLRRVAVDKSKIGPYSGEATGIKTHLVKSIKLRT